MRLNCSSCVGEDWVDQKAHCGGAGLAFRSRKILNEEPLNRFVLKKKPELKNSEIFIWYEHCDLSFHDIAVEVLELTNIGSRAKLLASQHNALRAIHIVAVALHGLLRRIPKRPITSCEEHALDIVRHWNIKNKNKDRPDEVVTTKSPGKNKDGESFHGIFKKLFTSQLTIPVSLFHNKMTAEHSERRNRAGKSASTDGTGPAAPSQRFRKPLSFKDPSYIGLVVLEALRAQVYCDDV